jgi:hypothetical protein
MLGPALTLCHYSGGMMTADIVEASQNAVWPYDEQNRFAGNLAGNVIARFAKLLRAADYVP